MEHYATWTAPDQEGGFDKSTQALQSGEKSSSAEYERLALKEIERAEQKKSIAEIFHTNPDLKKIGTEEEYEEYAESIFPESALQRVVWHGVSKHKEATNKIYEEGFSHKETLSSKNDLEFYGFYFGDRYSHYGGPTQDSIPAVLNIKKPRMINSDDETTLSSLDMTKGIKETYNLQDEDGIIQIGEFHGNYHISLEEHDAHIENISDQVKKVVSADPSFQDILNYVDKNGLDGFPLQEVVVLDPEQIHVLGSEKDLHGFQEFISSKKKS